jgi:hypothetical protein
VWRRVIQARVCCTDMGRCSNLWLWWLQTSHHPRSVALRPGDAVYGRPKGTFSYSFCCICYICMDDSLYGSAYKANRSEHCDHCVFLANYLCLAKELESLKLLEQPANWH